ncbi:hypothetical protein TGP89_200110, partial [Toxoplasma gondii p89]
MVLKENLRVKQVHQGEDPMDIGYQPGNVWSVGSEVDVSCCVFVERAVKPAEISGTVRECRHAPAETVATPIVCRHRLCTSLFSSQRPPREACARW